jgi:predicted nucleotidyltransferase
MSDAEYKVSEELRKLTKSIADWLSAAPDIKFYVYGSRVRGGHRPDSDVDSVGSRQGLPNHL